MDKCSSEFIIDHLLYVTEYLNYFERNCMKYYYKEVFNTLLVLCRIRNSFMIQRIDYRDNRYKHIFNIITNMVYNNPYLKTEEIDQGIIVMRKDTSFSLKYNYTHKELGEFLSYPYAGDIENGEYYYEIIVKYKEFECQLFGMIAGMDGTCKSRKFEKDLNIFFSNIYDVYGFPLVVITSNYKKKINIPALISIFENCQPTIGDYQDAYYILDNYGLEYDERNKKEIINLLYQIEH